MARQKEILIRPYQRKKKKRVKRILLLGLTILVLFTVTFYLFLNWVIKKETSELEKIRTKNQSLKSEIKRFQSSKEAYEELLRVRMGYIREGEKIINYK